ncbi:hypothetical protein JBL43_07780 [Aureibaculum sp. A20]|uniref:DUF304 domain-containing protein n=1 Tax=Aureibaculum flavum TaxID=2795986 RepID=A0ABS0WQ83_9FLAO|nr:hypothetical protein [Aureibaculum flavum]MBJ2174132.1 hypothetical protein [Aureibaculum flavum]
MKQNTKTNSNSKILKNEVFLKQHLSKLSLVFILLPFLFFVMTLSVFNSYFLLFSLLSIPVLSLNYKYVIKNNFENKLVIRMFSFSFFSQKKTLLYPIYISIVHQGYKEAGGMMWYPTVLGEVRYKLYVIKFFHGKKQDTVFKTSNKEKAIYKANELSKLLNVRIYNTLKS